MQFERHAVYPLSTLLLRRKAFDCCRDRKTLIRKIRNCCQLEYVLTLYYNIKYVLHMTHNIVKVPKSPRSVCDLSANDERVQHFIELRFKTSVSVHY